MAAVLFAPGSALQTRRGGAADDSDRIEQPPERLFFQSSRYAARLEELAVGRVLLKKGTHELTFEAIRTGRNGKFMLPIDFIRLRKVH